MSQKNVTLKSNDSILYPQTLPQLVQGLINNGTVSRDLLKQSLIYKGTVNALPQTGVTGDIVKFAGSIYIWTDKWQSIFNTAQIYTNSVTVDYLTQGYIVLDTVTMPTHVVTNKGTIYPVEKGSLIYQGDTLKLDPIPYLVYDNQAQFTGTWIIWRAGGKPGQDGAPGQDGQPGQDGATPTIQIGTVESGSQFDVIPQDTQTGVKLNFTLVKGKDGEDGATPTIQIGTVESGSQFDVTPQQTQTGVKLNFTFVKGEKGQGLYFNASGTLAQRLNYDDQVQGFVYLSTQGFLYVKASDAQGDWGPAIRAKGEDGQLASNYIEVSSLNQQGYIQIENLTIPVSVETNTGTIYPVEKGSLTHGSGVFLIDPAPYLAYDNQAQFIGTWKIWRAGGKKGDQGDTGEAGTITVGTVTKGDVASVINVGTETAAVLDIVLPKGDKGDKGDGFHFDATGSLNERSTYDGQPKGFMYLCNDGTYYIKVSNTHGDWSEALRFSGRDGSVKNLVTSLNDGGMMVIPTGIPTLIQTNSGNAYPVSGGFVSSSTEGYLVDPTPYLLADGQTAFTGTWTIYTMNVEE